MSRHTVHLHSPPLRYRRYQGIGSSSVSASIGRQTFRCHRRSVVIRRFAISAGMTSAAEPSCSAPTVQIVLRFYEGVRCFRTHTSGSEVPQSNNRMPPILPRWRSGSKDAAIRVRLRLRFYTGAQSLSWVKTAAYEPR
ncbi:hypothetical protein NDU88_006412 [Pleurodeles waltl]|uniref:Uncharacterized protein n=1 Tax=Pleurodeles waltl TaxID=8319 RepID=A0AAV7QL89_PLEWA|nr:hypothetical protein NDU88_006412 [Pleurodeles waltl]